MITQAPLRVSVLSSGYSQSLSKIAFGTGMAGSVIEGVLTLTATGGSGGTDISGINGIIKSNGVDLVGAALAGTDYLAPDGDGSELTGVLHSTDIADMATQTWVEEQGFIANPTDAAGVLTNDGSGNLSWGAASGSVAWAAITGTQTDVNVSGFTNDAGYLTAGNSVSDLTGGSTVASNASDGETAYSWGNHASAGYLVPTGTVAYQGDNVSEFTNDANYISNSALSPSSSIGIGYGTSAGSNSLSLGYNAQASGAWQTTIGTFSNPFNNFTDSTLILGGYAEMIGDEMWLKLSHGSIQMPALTMAGLVVTDSSGNITSVAANVSELNNDAGYLTSLTGHNVSELNDDIGIVNIGWLSTQSYVAFGNPVSYLTNDAGYITSASIPTNVSSFTNDAGYLTSSSLSGVAFGTNLYVDIYGILHVASGELIQLDGPTSIGGVLFGPGATDVRCSGSMGSAAIDFGGGITSLTYQMNAILTVANSVSDLTGGTTVASNASDGETAYGWGNHASAGYLTDISALTSGAVTSLSGHGVSELSNDSDFITDGSFLDNSSGANWATSTPTSINEAINRIATALVGLLATPIP